MKAFLRAVYMSFRYKWTILGSIACSFLIAMLWGASISAVFPIVKVVLEGETTQIWVANEIKRATDVQQQLTTEIDQLRQQQQATAVEQQAELQSQIHKKENRIATEQRTLEYYQWLQPHVEKYAPTTAYATLVWVMVGFLLATLVKCGLVILSAFLVARVAGKTGIDLQRIYFRKALELDQSTVERLGTSNMLTQLTANMTMVTGGLKMLYGKSLREPLKLITCLIGAALISWPLLLLSLFVVPVGAYLIYSIAGRMKAATTREVHGISEVYQALVETFNSLKTVRIFNRESTERHRFKQCTRSVYRMSLRIAFYDAFLRPISEFLGAVAIVISMLAGAYLVLHQETHLFGIQISNREMQPSMLILFYTMLAGASDPVRKMSEIVNALTRGGIACTWLEETYNTPAQTGVPETVVPVPAHSQCIEFRDIQFAYHHQPVLKNVSLQVPAGQTLAIVGGNGSGKTTLVNLLARFYVPQQGQILIDGVDIAQITPPQTTSPNRLGDSAIGVVQGNRLGKHCLRLPYSHR